MQSLLPQRPLVLNQPASTPGCAEEWPLMVSFTLAHLVPVPKVPISFKVTKHNLWLEAEGYWGAWCIGLDSENLAEQIRALIKGIEDDAQLR